MKNSHHRWSLAINALLLVLGLNASHALLAQTALPTFRSGQIFGQTNEAAVALFVGLDAPGKFILSGQMQSPTLSLGTTVLTNTGVADALVMKTDEAGNLIWVKQAGGSDVETGLTCAKDAVGNWYATAVSLSTNAFFDGHHITNGSPSVVFLAKIDPNGNTAWVRSLEGVFFPEITVDAEGNIILVGGTNAPISGAWSANLFITKFNSSGDQLWFKHEGMVGIDFGIRVQTDQNDFIYVAGNFTNQTQIGTVTLPSVDGADAFLAKYDSDGHLLWATNSALAGNEKAAGLATELNGHSYLASGGFLHKYNPAGDLLWRKPTPFSWRITLGQDGYLYEMTSPRLQSTNAIAKLNRDGDVIWLKSGYGATTNNFFQGAIFPALPAIDATGIIYLAGSYDDVCSLDSLQLSPRPQDFAQRLLIAKLAFDPRLRVSRNGNQLSVFWPANEPDFVLESTLTLSSSNLWQVITNLPSIVGDEKTVTNIPAASRQFFRLRQ